MPLRWIGAFRRYRSKAYVSIPSKLWQDSAFPFKEGDEVELTVDKDKLVVRKTDG